MYLYWIHLPEHTDIKTQGYVGITTNVQRRFKRHKKSTNEHLKNAFGKYGEQIIVDIILEEDEDFCLLLEQEFGPEKNIGWNIASGGGKPPTPEGPRSEETKEKLRGPNPNKRGPRGPQKNPGLRKARGSYGPQKNPFGLRGFSTKKGKTYGPQKNPRKNANSITLR